MKLKIEKMIYGGQGLSKIPANLDPHGGMRVFVPFTLPEEIVETEITEEHRGYCMAEARQIEARSEFRVDPPCPWFGTCGGCQLQHAAYLYQVELKREMLVESLQRAGVRDLPPITALTGEPWEYRNRVRLQVHAQPEFAIGYRQAKSHKMTAIDCCPIAAPLLERCMRELQTFGVEGLVPVDVREMEIFTNDDESQLLMTLWTRGHSQPDPNSYAEFFGKMQQRIPQLSGAAVILLEQDKTHAAKPMLQWGMQSLRYRVGARDYTVSQGSFFQVNRTLLDRFVNGVVDGERGQDAWDLYAGVGLFSLALVEKFQHVVVVESSASACGDLGNNLRVPNATVVSSTTLEFLRQASRQIVERRRPAPDLVLLDPPRAGAGVEACGLMARCSPRRIVYVSCDPATLGRDLGTLIQSGYRLDRLQLVDMFPQTYHLEAIATLNR